MDSRGYIKKKQANFYEEKGRIENGYIKKKQVNFYQELGKVEGSNCTDEAAGAGAVLLGILSF